PPEKKIIQDEEPVDEYDGRFTKVLHTIQMKLFTREDMVMSIMKNQDQQIQTLTDVVAQYEVLQAITSSGFADGPSRKGGPSHIASPIVFSRMQSNGSSQGQEINRRVQEGSQNTTLKRRLDFEVEEIVPNERFINIR
ncbi:hypothetical protein PIB30_083108, partial [Stylosanthes scabra]|nr:hypothetical protein [Stylosanthes scabra]